MKTLAEHLQTHTPHIWKSNHKRITHYETWLETKEISLEETQYKDILDYYHKIPDRTHKIRIKTAKSPQLPHFTQEELDQLYQSYQSTSEGYYRHSDKLILGLIIYQGLQRSDIVNLNLSELNLEQGNIHIRAGRSKKQSRTLALESHQVMALNHYITHHRESDNDKLLSRQCANLDRIYHQLKRLYKQVKSQGEDLEMKIQKLGQLRQSRIAHWIKTEGLRKAQYKGGFRLVSNVSVYQTQDLENLEDQIKQYHPLR